MIKCDKCGKYFEFGNKPCGIPNGIGFQLEDGTVYNMCAECIMSLTPEKAEEIAKLIEQKDGDQDDH